MDLAFKSLKSRDALYDAATRQIAAYVREELDARGTASLLLSGGSTPGPVYQNLSTIALGWKDVNIGLVDERWVDECDPGSNAALIRRTLLQNNAKPATFLPMKTLHETAAAGQKAVETSYSDLVNINSLAVLGMGTDGHVCSWFPQSQGLGSAVDPKNKHLVQAICAKKSPVTGDYLERMTLTLSALKKCKSVLLLISGNEKRDVIERAFESTSDDLPVSLILPLNNLTILHAA